jgi:hypothetical protein
MTADDFRQLALSMPEAYEGAHMGHADFRAGGRIFATLGYPGKDWGCVSLSPEQQRSFVLQDPDAFVPVRGGWGLKGATQVRLKAASEVTTLDAIRAAWQLVRSRGAAKAAGSRTSVRKPARKRTR